MQADRDAESARNGKIAILVAVNLLIIALVLIGPRGSAEELRPRNFG